MKIFLDTADTELIRKYYGTGLIDGVTTNPTLIKKLDNCIIIHYSMFVGRNMGVTE